jgi:DNA-directed RNA polymerase specialized sigma24 family protein
MADTDSSHPATPSSDARFATTRWTVILAAGSPDSSRYREALETLCQTYWLPIYAYLRRRGHTPHQAEDHIQGFFAYLLETRTLGRADPCRGKFRSFLLGTLKHFVADERDHAGAQKRGGGRPLLSLDIRDAESQYAIEPADRLSPDRLFQRHWALTVLNRTTARLRAEWAGRDKGDVFAALRAYLTQDEDAVPYRETAARLRMSEGAVKAAVHRLRRRYRELLCEEIAETVASKTQIDDEINDLFKAVAP